MSKKDKIRRAGWLSLALMFLLTGVVFTVIIIWQNVHQSDKATKTAACTIQSVPNAETGKDPKVEPHPAKLTKVETKDLSFGSGDSAKSGSCIKIKYYGALATNGKKFDSNYPQQTALQYGIGKSQVIPGMEMGVIGMKPGGERLIYIPAALGYGAQDSPQIPANSDLIFQVRLLGVQ